MDSLRDLEIGVMFWADKEPAEKIREVKALGVRCGQLGLGGDVEVGRSDAEKWKAAAEKENFKIVTVFAAYTGEDYSDAPTVERTVGFIPENTRAEREKRTYEISDFAAGLGAPGIACHIGFVPEDKSHPNHIAVRDLVRRIADHAAKHNQTFALETGQEPAPVLFEFLQDVGRPNVQINFDPANMILYGTGDPIEALDVLASHLVTVHCKDGDWPPKGDPNGLGTERPLGQGSVGMERFIDKLKEISYRGTLNVEREGQSPEQWREDVRAAVKLLERLRG